MIRKPRCPFCGYCLDDKGRCQHKKCTDYERTKILEALDKKQEEEAAANAVENAHDPSQDAGSSNASDGN